MFSDYPALYQESITDPAAFWAKIAKATLTWDAPWHEVHSGDFNSGAIQWFAGGKLNASVNCLDRHLAKYADKTALIWQGNAPEAQKKLTYKDLYELVNRFANLLKQEGIGVGDRVCIYMPMIPEAIAAMLASARIGAVHSVVFGGFAPEALKNRILDAKCKLVITVDHASRGANLLGFKANVDQALVGVDCVEKVLVVRHAQQDCPWVPGRDVDVLQALAAQEAYCAPESVEAETPLFILYTSGSTGTPKGILHSTGGYLTYAAYTFNYVFNLQPDDIYFCTADIGWITGHSYVVYGPLANAATIVIYEGAPLYPTPARMWALIDAYKVSIFYTAPTLIRTLMQQGDHYLEASSRQSLRLLASVGEPINPEGWEWYFNVVGQARCPIMDTWWQTETGGILMAPMVAMQKQKPGAAMKPFFGIVPAILTPDAQKNRDNTEGALVLQAPWPGMMRSIYGDHQRFIDAYLKAYPGYYATGDAARCDVDDDYWLLGRMDDVLNVSGHRLGTAEIESALVLHPKVTEAAVVGFPHALKGQGIYAFVSLLLDAKPSAELEQELIQLVRREIGSIAQVDYIQFVPDLPKTRSGKIMRRILRKMVEGEAEHLGDVSTLADPALVKLILHDLKIT